jgi:hypothetical protein
MYLRKIVKAPRGELYARPMHPFTVAPLYGSTPGAGKPGRSAVPASRH